MRKELIKNKSSFDWVLIIALLFLCFLGCVFIYSASSFIAEKDYGDKFFFVKKQLVGYGIGIVAFVSASLFDYRKLKKLSLPVFIASLILLALVLTPLGKEAYGAKRWIGVGGFTIQPSEITKLAFVIFASAYFSEDLSRIKTFKGLIPILLAGGITCLLIIAEPNMSVTVCVGVIMMAMLFIGGAKIKHLALICLPILFMLPMLIILEPYRLKRLMAFIDPWASPKGEGYQLIQSLYALGSGGLFGVGLFHSTQKLRFLPFAESDFILSIIGEETGFVGIVFLLGICALIALRIIATAKASKDFFGYFLSTGVACIFIIQIAVNILVVTGSIPPTGLPFPLISSGNTQIITFLGAFGIINNVYRNNKYNLTKKTLLA
ncbi:MAG: putative lipid II flippase FtsW [Clostridia bacterium]|nr:putative lipid II flippase FtsW [Clostridia bacterium]